jgi:cation diffusion facilitator family transporter
MARTLLQMTPAQTPTRRADGEDALSRTARARTAALTVPLVSNSLLVVAKLAVWLVSGSVSVLSEAVHSATDLFVTTVQLITVRLAARPADHDHAYGHGKFENVSAAFEALFIMAVAAFVVWQAIAKLHAPAAPAHLEIGIAVMIASAVINCFVWLRLRKVADLEQSPALQAEAMQLQADVWTALGVAGGLAAIRFTGLVIIDPILSLLIAGLIVRSAYEVTARAVIDLTDGRLPPDQEAHIREIIERHRPIFVGYHKLRTRRAGGGEFIDFHLQMRSDMPLKEAHDQSDTIVVDIKRELPRAHVLIHLEPEE